MIKASVLWTVLSNGLPLNGPASTQSTPPLKPLVAYLDGKDCSVELGLLKDFSNVAFCDAVHAADIHDRVCITTLFAYYDALL